MTKSLLRDSLILIAIFGAMWAVFTFFPIFSFKKEDFDVSVEQEEKLGKVIVDNLLDDKTTTVVKDPIVDSAIFIISKRLTENIGPTDYEYNFKVIQNDQINAFTLPGGNIFIYSGLIEFSEGPEEVAAVLAHEIGHAEKRHVIRKLVKELGITVVFSVLTGGDGMVLKEISRTALSTVFDREQEREADQFGFTLMEKSSLNPKAFATFFRRLNDKYKNYGENLELLMTHPNNNSRIKASLEYKLPENFKTKSFNLNWEEVKESLKNNSEDQ